MSSPAGCATPLSEFISGIAAILTRDEETRCVGVLDKVVGFPQISGPLLQRLHDEFLQELQTLGWDDVGRWIESWTPPYRNSMDDLASASTQAHELFGSHYSIVSVWNDKFRIALRDIPMRTRSTRSKSRSRPLRRPGAGREHWPPREKLCAHWEGSTRVWRPSTKRSRPSPSWAASTQLIR